MALHIKQVGVDRELTTENDINSCMKYKYLKRIYTSAKDMITTVMYCKSYGQLWSLCNFLFKQLAAFIFNNEQNQYIWACDKRHTVASPETMKPINLFKPILVDCFTYVGKALLLSAISWLLVYIDWLRLTAWKNPCPWVKTVNRSQ